MDMNSPSEVRHWSTISPDEAKDIRLPRPEIVGPVNERGRPCPWPWEPQQVVGAQIGQYHCSYCGTLCLAGCQHPDYGASGPDELDDERGDFDEDDQIEEAKEPDDEVVRAKWTMDGATTLHEAAEKLRAFAAYLDELDEQGSAPGGD
jgi:hypothetical protein